MEEDLQSDLQLIPKRNDFKDEYNLSMNTLANTFLAVAGLW